MDDVPDPGKVLATFKRRKRVYESMRNPLVLKD
jgi:hypothetical protein